LPAWGTILLPFFVRFVRPVTPAEERWFIEEVKGSWAVSARAVD